MDAKKPAVCEYSNMLLVTYLTLVKGHALINTRRDQEDPRKSYAVFLKTDALIKDVDDYHNDIPCLIKPRTYEKQYKDLKFLLNNPNLIGNRKGV